MPPGRPRSESARRAILGATRVELTERGYDKFSIDRVALAAGVGKQTVYRWYASKNSLIAESLLHGYITTPAVPVEDSDDLVADIARWVDGFMRTTEHPAVVALIRATSAAAAEDPAIARSFQQQVHTSVRSALAGRLRRGQADGQVRAEVSPVATAEIVVGALLYRLATHETITEEFAADLCTVLLGGVLVHRDQEV